MTRAFAYSLAICSALRRSKLLAPAVASDGGYVNYASRRMPFLFFGWVLIGGAYHVISFAVLYRLFLVGDTRAKYRTLASRRDAADQCGLELLLFSQPNLLHCFLLSLPYSVIAVALFVLLLWKIDREAPWWILPYLLYLCYADVWGCRIWRLNTGDV